VMARLRSSSSSGSAATSLAMAMATVPTMMLCVLCLTAMLGAAREAFKWRSDPRGLTWDGGMARRRWPGLLGRWGWAGAVDAGSGENMRRILRLEDGVDWSGTGEAGLVLPFLCALPSRFRAKVPRNSRTWSLAILATEWRLLALSAYFLLYPK
jgi:hypothetical protein